MSVQPEGKYTKATWILEGKQRTATVGTGNPVGIFSAMGMSKACAQRIRSLAIHAPLSVDNLVTRDWADVVKGCVKGRRGEYMKKGERYS